jgi:hypothetical protein
MPRLIGVNSGEVVQVDRKIELNDPKVVQLTARRPVRNGELPAHLSMGAGFRGDGVATGSRREVGWYRDTEVDGEVMIRRG